MKLLVELGILVEGLDGVHLSENWRQTFEDYIASSPAGTSRLEKGNHRRRRERIKRRQTVERGLLTDAERMQIRDLECWFPGCTSRGREPDHFPPKRFLASFEDTLSPHVLFAACQKHNRKYSKFIASLPDFKPEPREYSLAKGADPMRLFRTSNNLNLAEFIQHAENRNVAGALAAISRSADFFHALENAGFTKSRHITPPLRKRRLTRRKGSAVRNRKSTFDSQI